MRNLYTPPKPTREQRDAEKRLRDLDRRCDAAIERLRAAPWDEADFPASAAAIIKAVGGDPAVFMKLDEQPGYFGGYRDPSQWVSKLRQVRNHPTFGPQLFRSFQR